jgi:hypothetical protein
MSLLADSDTRDTPDPPKAQKHVLGLLFEPPHDGVGSWGAAISLPIPAVDLLDGRRGTRPAKEDVKNSLPDRLSLHSPEKLAEIALRSRTWLEVIWDSI